MRSLVCPHSSSPVRLGLRLPSALSQAARRALSEPEGRPFFPVMLHPGHFGPAGLHAAARLLLTSCLQGSAAEEPALVRVTWWGQVSHPSEVSYCVSQRHSWWRLAVSEVSVSLLSPLLGSVSGCLGASPPLGRGWRGGGELLVPNSVLLIGRAF